MPGFIKKITLKEILAIKGKQGVSLRRRLMVYLLSLILTGVGLLLLLLFLFGVFNDSRNSQVFRLHLDNTTDKLQERIGFMAGSGLELSKGIAMAMEKHLEYPYDIQNITNDKEAILELEQAIYPILEKYLDVVRVSGALVVMDTTVNDKIPGKSRSGLYLHVGNVSSTSSVDKEVYLFRGMSEIARENRIRMHNRWTMEMDVEQMGWYETQENITVRKFVLSKKQKLDKTWEDVMYICVPVEGSNQEHYGISGLEMNGLLFRLGYPPIPSEYGELIVAMAPMEGNLVHIKDGMVGKANRLSKLDVMTVKTGKHYNTYIGQNASYIGLHAPLGEVYTEDGKIWNVLILASEENVQRYVYARQRVLIAGILSFAIIMFTISMFISKRYVKPIVDIIEKIKNESQGTLTGISELDALSEYMTQIISKQDTMQQSPSDLPPNIKILFDNFIERSKTLTMAEKGILQFYIQGYSIPEVPELAFVSLNTVRKHNRSIYEKLHVSSIDELKLYIDLLKRLDMLGKLE